MKLVLLVGPLTDGLAAPTSGWALSTTTRSFDDQKVQDFDDLYNALDQHHAGDTVNVRLQRQRETLSVPMQVVVVQ